MTQSVEIKTQAKGDNRLPIAANFKAGALADRTTAKMLREEIVRLQGQRKRLLGEIIASAKRGQIENVERRTLILAKTISRLSWALDEIVRLGAETAQPAKDSHGKLFPRYDFAEERRKARALAEIAKQDK